MSAPQYLLRVWGKDDEQITGLRPPDLREGDEGPLCYWFDTPGAREAFIASWPHGVWVMRALRDPGYDDDDGERIEPRSRTVARIVLRWPDGRAVTIEQSFGYGYSAHGAEFMYRDGNYACDCNRRLFMWRQEGLSEDAIDALDNPCGDTIELVSLDIRKEPLDT